MKLCILESFRRCINIKILTFTVSIGSLVADYVITLDRKVNITSLERNISDALKTIASVDMTIGDRSFSGQVDTTQSLTGI